MSDHDASRSLTGRLAGLLAEHPVLDTHNDLPWRARRLVDYDWDRLDLLDPAAGPAAGTHTDLPRMRAGGLGAQFWSVYVPCSFTGADAVTATLEQIDAVRAMIARYDDLAAADTVAEVEAAWAAGRIACLIGAEGGHQIDESLGVLRSYRRLGVRYLTLTHNDSHTWADSATGEVRHHGLTDVGRAVVAEMNRIGMIVDLSHVSAETMRDALDVTRSPVLFTHSNARAVCDHPRNVPDDVLDRVPGNGGVVCATFVPRFVSQAVRDWAEELEAEACAAGLDPANLSAYEPFLLARAAEHPPPPCGVADVADQVDALRERVGVDHVGIGGDYDGIPAGPTGLEDVSRYPALLAELSDRGWSQRDLAALTCRNVLRVLDAADVPRNE